MLVATSWLPNLRVSSALSCGCVSVIKKQKKNANVMYYTFSSVSVGSFFPNFVMINAVKVVFVEKSGALLCSTSNMCRVLHNRIDQYILGA